MAGGSCAVFHLLSLVSVQCKDGRMRKKQKSFLFLLISFPLFPKERITPSSSNEATGTIFHFQELPREYGLSWGRKNGTHTLTKPEPTNAQPLRFNGSPIGWEQHQLPLRPTTPPPSVHKNDSVELLNNTSSISRFARLKGYGVSRVSCGRAGI